MRDPPTPHTYARSANVCVKIVGLSIVTLNDRLITPTENPEWICINVFDTASFMILLLSYTEIRYASCRVISEMFIIFNTIRICRASILWIRFAVTDALFFGILGMSVVALNLVL